MTGSYGVDSAALNAHAATVRDLADQLRAASDDVGGVSMTGQAYGETCDSAVSVINSMNAAGQRTLRAAVESLEATAADLRAIAANYDQREADEAAAFGGIGGSLP